MTLIESIYRTPEYWRITRYTMNHESGAKLWIANGVFFCNPYPGGNYSLLDKWRAWRAYKWWCHTVPVEMLRAER